MRTIAGIVGILLLLPLGFSCKKSKSSLEDEISQATKDKITALGFSATDVKKVPDGYIVEEDIFLSEADLDAAPAENRFLRIAENEQYRTNNLIRNLPRTITVSLAANLPATYGPALDEAIRRFNSEHLQVTFQRVSPGHADISMIKEYGNYLASAGFPTDNGNAFPIVKINSYVIGPGENHKIFYVHLATIMSHEL